MSKNFEYTHSFDDWLSTVIRHVAYNENAQELLVGLDSRLVYVYGDVSKRTFDGFKSAASRGSYYNRYIKGHARRANGDNEYFRDFTFRKVDVPVASTGTTKTKFTFTLPQGAEVTFNGAVTTAEFQKALAEALPGVTVKVTSRTEVRVENF